MAYPAGQAPTEAEGGSGQPVARYARPRGDVRVSTRLVAMTGLTRSLRPAAVLAAVLTGLVAGCASGTSSLSLSAAGSSPSRPASAVPVSGPATATTAPS